jgi:hypothetical protein
MTKSLYCWLNCLTNTWRLGRQSLGYYATDLVRGDIYMARIFLENLPADANPAAATPLLMFKTAAQLAAADDFTLAFTGYDTGDAYHQAGGDTRKISVPFVLPYTLDLTEHFVALALFDGDGAKIESKPFRVAIVQNMYVGTEPTNPMTSSGPQLYSLTISGSDLSVNQTVAGLTSATGKIVIAQESSTGGFTLAAVSIPSDGTFTVTVPTAPELTTGDGRTFKFTAWVAHL